MPLFSKLGNTNFQNQHYYHKTKFNQISFVGLQATIFLIRLHKRLINLKW